jgi:hypothetical protein
MYSLQYAKRKKIICIYLIMLLSKIIFILNVYFYKYVNSSKWKVDFE